MWAVESSGLSQGLAHTVRPDTCGQLQEDASFISGDPGPHQVPCLNSRPPTFTYSLAQAQVPEAGKVLTEGASLRAHGLNVCRAVGANTE